MLTQPTLTTQLKPYPQTFPIQGWAAFALEAIPLGFFVCEYAGELLGRDAAEWRLQEYDRRGAEESGHALLVRLLWE